MSLGSCPRCWETPCECGYMYQTYPMSWLKKMRDVFDRLIREQEKGPTA